MDTPESDPDARGREIQALLEAIQLGTITEVDELSESDRALLFQVLGSDEAVQALFDRLANGGLDR
jgi:hypothetical protein